MCGIAGFIGTQKVSREILENMISSISYRGPEFTGIYHNENCGLAHARLRIIDLDNRSNQPFFSTDGNFCIVFNGEIYNYKEIRLELQKQNKYDFVTSSDTEVLLYAYIEYQEKVLDIIQGMFAFAVLDLRDESLFLARDRMGQKPLYYFNQGQEFIFASEPKAIFEHPTPKKGVNIETLFQYLTFDYVPTPDSIYAHVHKLEPGHYLRFNDGQIENIPYYKVSFEKHNFSFEDARQELDLLLDKAVNKRLISDVPLGVFLSGGIDSSTVAYYAQKNATEKVKTFSIGFNESSYDESSYAQMVAKHLATEHHHEILTPSGCLDLLPKVLDLLDEPFADPSVIPTFLLSSFTKTKVTVALGGDGADELLAGYPTFISEKLAFLFKFYPKQVLKGLYKLSDRLPKSHSNISFDFKVKQFMKGFMSEEKYRHPLWLGSFTEVEKHKLLKDSEDQFNSLGLPAVDYALKNCDAKQSIDQIIYVYLKTYLVDDILFKVDRASMYNALEVRSPFLDSEVVDFSTSLKHGFRISGFNGKHILKKLMVDKLPRIIIERPKKGFGIPVSLWLKNELKEVVSEVLFSSDPFFNEDYIKTLYKEHLEGKRNHRKLLWNLFVFKNWYFKNFNS